MLISDGQRWPLILQLDFCNVGWRAFRQLKKVNKVFLVMSMWRSIFGSAGSWRCQKCNSESFRRPEETCFCSLHGWIWMIWYVELSSANLDYEEIDSSSSPIATSESWSCFNTLMFHGHFHGKIEWESFPVDSPAINCHAVTEPKTNIFRPKSRPPHATGEHQVLSKLFHQIPQDYIYRATPNSMEQCNSWNEKKWRKHHPKSVFHLLPCPAGTSAS